MSFFIGNIAFGGIGGSSGGGGGGSGSGITNINGATGPLITFAGRDGIYINRVTNSIFVGLDMTQSGFIRNPDFVSSGFATFGELYTSGYIRNEDFVSSGFLKTDNIKPGSGVDSVVVVGNDVYINTSGTGSGGGGVTSGVISDAEWFLAEYNHGGEQFDHAYFVTQEVEITQVLLYGNSPSGTTTLGVSSGLPGETPTTIYTSNPKPNVSGLNQVSSGLLPDTVTIPQGTLLYVEQTSIHTSASGIRFSIIFNNSDAVAGGGGGTSDHGALNGLTDNDHPQYILNSDFIGSGFQTAAQLAESGLITRDIMNASGYALNSDLHASGYVRNADLLSSGYVESLNGLNTDIDIVGSGDTNVWVDGQTIQINHTGGGGGGDVTGPASSTDNALARFDGTTGKVLQSGKIVLGDDGNLLPADDGQQSLGSDSARFSGIYATRPIDLEYDTGGVTDATDLLRIYDTTNSRNKLYYSHRNGMVVDVGESRGIQINRDGTASITIGNTGGIPYVGSADANPLALTARESEQNQNFCMAFLNDVTPAQGTPLLVMGVGGATAISELYWMVSSGGYFIPGTDNTYDIGNTESGVRTIYANQILVGTDNYGIGCHDDADTGISFPSANTITFRTGGGTRFTIDSGGDPLIANGSDLVFGAKISAFARINHQGSVFRMRLGDDSGWAAWRASSGQLEGEMVFAEQSDHTLVPQAGHGYLWVRDDSPNKLIFTDDDGTDHDLTAGGGGSSAAAKIRLQYNLEGAVPSGGMSGVDGARFIEAASTIQTVSLFSNTPSGNVIVTLSSGAPGHAPVSMYTTSTKPTVSGLYAHQSGIMPTTSGLDAGTLLYCDIEEAPYGVTASGMNFTVVITED